MLGGPGRARAVYALLRSGRDPFTAPEAAPGARARLADRTRPTPLEIREHTRALDGTQKLLLGLASGHAIEVVLIPELASPSGRTRQARTTLCVSSQVGCKRGCTFCLTATMKLVRDLTAAEIVAQLALGLRLTREEGLPPLRNVVFMGMGEPLDNLEAVRGALRIATTSGVGLGFGPAHVTVSTVGPSPERVLAAAELPGRIAWSLHAADDALRARLVPTHRSSVAELREVFLEVVRRRRSPLFVELTLIDGVNDGPGEAAAAADLFAGTGVEVRFNLLPMNPIGPGAGPLRPSSPERVAAFARVLRDAGFLTLVRKARGGEERAACGQLAVLPGAAARLDAPRAGRAEERP